MLYICSAPVLIFPNLTQPFVLQTDASRDVVGAILCQRNLENHAQLVAYASRKLSKVECNYNISDREGLAVIFGIKHFWQYLHGSRFVKEADHSPLKALLKSRDLTGRLARSALVLQSYECEIYHKPGRLHSDADALTHMTDATTEQYSKFSDHEQHQHFMQTDLWAGFSFKNNSEFLAGGC